MTATPTQVTIADLPDVEVLTLAPRTLGADEFLDRDHMRPKSARVYRAAMAEDIGTLITRSTLIRNAVSGQPVMVYLCLPATEPTLLRIGAALPAVPYQRQPRTAGLLATTRTFGYAPRVPMKQDFCRKASLAFDAPALHDLIAGFAPTVDTYYRACHPALYAEHAAEVATMLPDWHIEGSVFTSGIVNQNNVLPYHFDKGNVRTVWSNMVAFRRGTEGGWLSVPAYGVGFEIANHSLLMFDGGALLHGVTPMRRVTKDAYRYTIVYYSLQGLWQCDTRAGELARIRQKRTEREFSRARKRGDLPPA